MTWPTEIISTQHLDSGSDSPVLARPAIYQTAVNVNLIQDSITTAGASNGSLLSYNTDTDRFEPSASTSSLGFLVKIAVIEGGNIVSDPYGFVTDNGADWTVGTGTYLLHTYTQYDVGFRGGSMRQAVFPSFEIVSGGTYNSTNARIFKIV
jgi:hypothetical protein